MALALRPTAAADLDFVRRLEADPEAAPFIVAWSKERHLVAIESPDESHHLLVDDGAAAGFVLLAGLSDEQRVIELRRIVVGEKGRGVGREALRLVLAEAFSRLGAERVWLDLKPANTRARRAYAAVGFVEEGVVPDALETKDGPEPLLVMSLSASAWSAEPSAREPGR